MQLRRQGLPVLQQRGQQLITARGVVHHQVARLLQFGRSCWCSACSARCRRIRSASWSIDPQRATPSSRSTASGSSWHSARIAYWSKVSCSPTPSARVRASLESRAAAVSKIGVVGLHFHDLRHAGNMLSASGASLGDLEARMGHDSARAAMIYQHATAEADQLIADALDRRIAGAGKAINPGLDDDEDGPTGVLAKTG